MQGGGQKNCREEEVRRAVRRKRSGWLVSPCCACSLRPPCPSRSHHDGEGAKKWRTATLLCSGHLSSLLTPLGFASSSVPWAAFETTEGWILEDLKLLCLPSFHRRAYSFSNPHWSHLLPNRALYELSEAPLLCAGASSSRRTIGIPGNQRTDSF